MKTTSLELYLREQGPPNSSNDIAVDGGVSQNVAPEGSLESNPLYSQGYAAGFQAAAAKGEALGAEIKEEAQRALQHERELLGNGLVTAIQSQLEDGIFRIQEKLEHQIHTILSNFLTDQVLVRTQLEVERVVELLFERELGEIISIKAPVNILSYFEEKWKDNRFSVTFVPADSVEIELNYENLRITSRLNEWETILQQDTII